MIRECSLHLAPLVLQPRFHSGVGGGVVSQGYFKSQFGITDASGNTDTKKATNINSNVVSVLQAGAFFGALGSAPLSGTHGHSSPACVIFGFVRQLSINLERDGADPMRS